jgi:phosphoribosylaminoimidazolecarboxamide formyltransferase/IMP cyclohydrolase
MISSGGTGRYISDHKIPFTPIEKVTKNPEAFAGRMKTLSFQVASALLYRREEEADIIQAKELGIEPIDLVICNCYPFGEVVKKGGEWAELIENIDIGGPTMIRAAAKNHRDVAIITNPSQYGELIALLKENQGQTYYEFRKKLAVEAFRSSAAYEMMIASELEQRTEFTGPKTFSLAPSYTKELRYGENPHQAAWVYADPTDPSGEKGLAQVTPLQGKALSYNNLLDADAAWRSARDLLTLTNGDKYSSVVTIIKHLNPCGAALSTSPSSALEMAWNGDPISSFGSIICFSEEVDEASALWLKDKFVEVILAPSFSKEALELFSKKKNLRLIPMTFNDPTKVKEYMVRSISGGWVVQNEDNYIDNEFKTVTKKKMDESLKELTTFGVLVCKHLKSNAIALVGENKSGRFLMGAGMGNPNRLISLDQAVDKAHENGHNNLENAILISDAFFPFSDNIELANKAGIKNIIQPGGSIRDEDVIAACDKYEMTMTFTGHRHFRH